ncbi:MAG: hypothetical protein GWM98_26835, partial [Nitrospinaceae bacterium]|nr:hypothetical protein [Nitrospinaceae bacterium]NIR57418.1 hypothetical protein [Nitrospinaceae bacterium]NIS87876.1 hypothetical protein [Nitrospinaceae bacterium]NIT84743.1 hypothetical protein [Nitrospinaceae bacterium]NIU46921.1 hypothetical protein [Nitrospinaceae bacterium]
GEVDTEQVCGVVQELNNIAGGIVKPKISDRAREILSLVAPHAERREEPGRSLNLALGLPLTRMGEDAPFPFEENGSCRFFLPFDIQGDKIVLSVGFHSSGDLPDRSHA